MGLRLRRRGLRLGGGGVVAVQGDESRLLVAGAVAAERLERRELPVAGLALEDSAWDAGGDGVEAGSPGEQHQAVGYADVLVLSVSHPLHGHRIILFGRQENQRKWGEGCCLALRGEK